MQFISLRYVRAEKKNTDIVVYLLCFSLSQEARAVPRELEFNAEDDSYQMDLEPVYNGKQTISHDEVITASNYNQAT